jgi:hypothetical protein
MGELNGLINRYLDKNPILTKAEQKEINAALESAKEYGMPEKAKKKGKYAEPTPVPKEEPKAKAEPKTYELEPPPFGRK